MGIISNLFKRTEVPIDTNSLSDVLLEAVLNGNNISKDLALSIPVVSECIDLASNIFATIPFKLYEESSVDGKKTTKELIDNRVNLINDDTKSTMDGYQFKQAIASSYFLDKGAYAYINKLNNKILSLHFVQTKYISLLENEDPIFKKYTIQVNGKNYDSFQFLKILRNTSDGISGIGIVNQIQKSLENAVERLKYEYSLTKTGGSRKGFLMSKNHLQEDAIKKLKEAWNRYYDGNANTVILNDGIEFKEASNTSKENEINEKNISFRDEIKGIFHMNDGYDVFIKETIKPLAEAFCIALNRELLLEKEKKTLYFAPDYKELMKCNIKERYEAYKIAIETGIKTRNEIRYLEDDNPLDGLDMINLGLGDVLLDPETKEIYTPNTNSFVQIGVPNVVSNTEKGGDENENGN